MAKLPEFLSAVAVYGIADTDGTLLTKEAVQHMADAIREKGFKIDGKEIQVHSVSLVDSPDNPEIGCLMLEWSHQ